MVETPSCCLLLVSQYDFLDLTNAEEEPPKPLSFEPREPSLVC